MSIFFGQFNLEAQTAPIISYTTPNNFIKGEPITPLEPTNTGGAVSTTVQVSTFVGSGAIGNTDGAGTTASFSNFYGITIDPLGNLYVADTENRTIRKITQTGLVSTFAGSGQISSADGTGTAAGFSFPVDIASDTSGNLYVIDYNLIRKITPLGVVTTLAGSSENGDSDGTGTAASFNGANGITVDRAGNIYVAEITNCKIRKIAHNGVVTTFAGNGVSGFADGIGTATSFYEPMGVASDAAGNVYVADSGNHKIRKITPTGVVTTHAGNGQCADVDGIATIASFCYPPRIATDAIGNVYVCDRNNNKIKKIDPTGLVTTIAGSGELGAIDGTGATASFYLPEKIVADALGFLYVADTSNHKIRKITYGYYTIVPALPGGLLFNTITGEITGTPTTITPTSTHTVKATNDFGTSVYDIAITVNAPINTDTDSDGVNDSIDNCPALYNPNQADRNKDGIGDACDNSLELLVSEAITPNGDGINDTWMIYNIEKHLGGTSARVFNRWGSEVFYSGDYKNDWDGSGLPESAYYYKVILNGDSSKEIKGWLYITK